MSFPALAVGDVFTLKYGSVLYGQQMIADLAYKVRTISGGTIDQQIFLAQVNTDHSSFPTLPWTQIQNAQCPEVSYTYIQSQVLFPARGLYNRTTVAGAGGFGGTAAPPSDSAVITKRVVPATRSAVGHLCISGFDKAAIVGGRWTGSAITSMNTIGPTLLSSPVHTVGGVNVTCDPVVFRRGNPAASPLIVLFDIIDVVRTQKRRVVGRGI